MNINRIKKNIKKVEEIVESIDVQDVINRMEKDKENSIEEDIKIVENYLANSAINEIDSDFFKNGGWETVDLEIPKSMQHILSDYKRVLKENEILKKEKE